MGPAEIPQLVTKLPGNHHRTLALQKADDRGHRMLGRDLNTHMDMVRQQMALHNPTFLLPREVMKDPAQARSDLTLDRLTAILRHEHHVILAFPARVRQALPARFSHTVLLWIGQQAILGGTVLPQRSKLFKSH